MIAILIDNVRFLGGYGDRIVGLVSLKLVAKLLGQSFGIVWTKDPSLQRYFHFSEVAPKPVGPVFVAHCIDCPHFMFEAYRPHKARWLSGDEVIYIRTNQENGFLWYEAAGIPEDVFITDAVNLYNKLYKEIMVPTDYMKEVTSLVVPPDCANVIGIQIRSGDTYMGVGDHRPIKDPREIWKLLQDIFEAEMSTSSSTSTTTFFFVTSDYPDIRTAVDEIIPASQVLSYDKPIVHLDRSVTSSDDDDPFSKTFVDHYVLARCTHKMYISSWSNFGKTAALAADHDNIFDVRSRDKIEKASLIRLCKAK